MKTPSPALPDEISGKDRAEGAAGQEAASPSAGAVDPEALLKSPEDLSPQDAAALQFLLTERFGDVLGSGADPSESASQSAPASRKSRLIKTALGIALVVAVGWMPAQRLFQVSSVEALVNARLVTLRAPINGIVSEGAGALLVGDPVSPGKPILAVANPRIDRSILNEAIDRLQQARDERRGQAVRLEAQERMRDSLVKRIAAFRGNRLRLIEARVGEADARLASATAVEARADSTLRRHMELTGRGFLSPAALEDARRDRDVARAGTREAHARKAALVVEADALRDGDFFGDNYNDEPQSAHRLDEVEQSMATLQGEIALQDQRVESASAAVQRARDAFSLASQAEIRAPVEGRIWEMLTAPGEQVIEGQDLARVLDCSEAIVTAAVSESVYNSLTVGRPASFSFSEGGASYSGKVVQLSGVATASSNFAILPSALTRESYRVAVALAGAPTSTSCAIGRTGRVVFQSPAT